MKQLVITGILIAETPVCHCGTDGLFRLPVCTFAYTEEDENGERHDYIGIKSVLSISPNHFRAIMRDRCAEAVWEKLPENAKDMYTHRMLFSGGFQQESSKKGKDAEDGESKKELKSSPLAMLKYTEKNIFIDMWGGNTQMDGIQLVPSRVRTSIMPLYKQTQHFWHKKLEVKIGKRIEKIEQVLSLTGFSDVMSSYIQTLIADPPGCPSPIEIPVTVVNDITKDLIKKYKDFYELDTEFLQENQTLLKFLQGRNFQTIKACPPGVSFVCDLVLPFNDDEGEEIQKLKVGCILQGIENFAYAPFMGGKISMGMGMFSGVFLVELIEDRKTKEEGYLLFDGPSGVVESYYQEAPFLQASLETFKKATPQQMCLFLDPETRPKKLVEQLKKAKAEIARQTKNKTAKSRARATG